MLQGIKLDTISALAHNMLNVPMNEYVQSVRKTMQSKLKESSLSSPRTRV